MDHNELPVPEGQPANRVIDLLRELLHACLKSSMPAWLNLQLTLPQLRTLFLIAHSGTSSVMQVSTQLCIGEPTASHLIDKLVQASLVERKEDPADRRRALVQLSPEGASLIDELMGWENLVGEPLREIPQKDIASLIGVLSSIVNAVNAKKGETE